MAMGTLTEYEKLPLEINRNTMFSSALGFTKNDNPKVVLQAVQILDHLRDPRALETLISFLYSPDLCVVQAAITAIGHLGNSRTVSNLLTFLNAEPKLQIIAIQALGDLRDPLAVRPLAKLLKNSMSGSLAAGAIARIGGPTAFRVLAEYWLKIHSQLDSENFLSLLAHVAEGSTQKLPRSPGLRKTLEQYLNHPSRLIRYSAARCLLSLGAGQEDQNAVSILAEILPDSQIIPSCLKSRNDLISYLLSTRGITRNWGFQLASLFSKVTPIAVLLSAISTYENDDPLVCIVNILLTIREPNIAPVLLDLYLRVPVSSRHLLNPVIRLYKKDMGSLLIDSDMDDETRLVIASLLGTSPACTALEILDLPQDSYMLVMSQITDCKAILKFLPR